MEMKNVFKKISQSTLGKASVVVIVLALFLLLIQGVKAMSYPWINPMSGGSQYARGFGVALGLVENPITVGDFAGTLDLTPYSGSLFTATDGYDLYVAAFDKFGSVDWDAAFGGDCYEEYPAMHIINCDDQALSVTTDSQGNVIVTGKYIGPMTMGSTILPSYGEEDVFVAKFDKTGTLLWVVDGGGTGEDIGRDVAVDANDDIYVTGSFTDYAEFQGIPVSSSTLSRTAFLAKISSGGMVSYVKSAGGLSDDYGTTVATNQNNDVVLATICYGDVFFDTITLTGDSYDVCLAQYDQTGSIMWAIREGISDGVEEANAVAVDSNDNIVVTGRFNQDTNFSGQALTTPSGGVYSVFIAQYDSLGVLNWVTQSVITANPMPPPTSLASSNANGVAIDVHMKDEIHIVGTYAGEMSFGSYVLPRTKANDGVNVYIVELDSNGNAVWVDVGGGVNTEVITDIASHPLSDLRAFTGRFFEKFDIGSYTFNAGSTADAFVGVF